MIEQKYTSKADIFALNSFTVFETKDRVVCRGSMVITKDAVLWNQWNCTTKTFNELSFFLFLLTMAGKRPEISELGPNWQLVIF